MAKDNTEKLNKRSAHNKVVAIACAVAAVAVVVAVMAALHPWGAGDEQKDVGMSDGGGTVEDGGQQPGWSQGYVGPDGEGSIKGSDYATNEEYLEALSAAGGGKEHDIEREAVYDSDGGGYSKGFLNIRFYKSCSEYDAHQIVAGYGGVWESDTYIDNDGRDYAMVTAYFVDYPYKEDLEALSAELEARPEVMDASYDAIGYPSEGQSVSGNSVVQYYLSNSQFYKAWTLQRCSHSTEIAVIDSGFALDHEDLTSNMLPGWDAATGTILRQDLADGSGHGTMVAGIASAVEGNSLGIDGASGNAYILPMRNMDNGGTIYWSYIVSDFQRLLELPNKPEVVNMSFEFRNVPKSSIDALQMLVNQASENYGIVCIAASGNLRVGEQITDIKYPAALDNVISVASVDASNTVAPDSNRNCKVDICAPGVGVYSTANPLVGGLSYGTASGTSFAAPQVAAAAALVKAQNPSWTVAQVENRLIQKARKLPAMNGASRTDEYGYGALDAAAAVGYAYNPVSPNTGGSVRDLWLSVKSGF